MILDYALTLALCVSCAVAAPSYTPNEVKYLPLLKAEITTHWPEVAPRSSLGAQIRQETCPSLKSKSCYSPRAELKTSREYGFGLGQITVTDKFDNFKEAKKLDSSMRDWKWGDRYNPVYQLRTMVLTDKFNYGKFSWAADNTERMAFAFAAYNGGIGGVLSDRAVCRATPGCDPSRWFGNIEHTSKKAKVAANGYGKGFFYINRDYVQHILGEYRERYVPYFGE